MEKTDYLMLVQDICGLKLSGSVGGGYSYDKMELWSVLNGLHCYDIMSDISNKEKSYGTVWSRVDQDELLHSVENMTGYSTYAYSKKSYDECMRTASESIEVMNKKGILDYSDKRHIDRIISQIAFGLSIKLEKNGMSVICGLENPGFIKFRLFRMIIQLEIMCILLGKRDN